jgi:hypothetical protein
MENGAAAMEILALPEKVKVSIWLNNSTENCSVQEKACT